jgi:hypothetical protein
MNNKYRKKGAKIGLWVGIIGTIIFSTTTPLLGSIIPLPNAITFPFTSIIKVFPYTGIFGCDYQVDVCYGEMLVGAILTVLVFWWLGAIVGSVFDYFQDEHPIDW